MAKKAGVGGVQQLEVHFSGFNTDRSTLGYLRGPEISPLYPSATNIWERYLSEKNVVRTSETCPPSCKSLY